jgi:hypothetical protein
LPSPAARDRYVLGLPVGERLELEATAGSVTIEELEADATEMPSGPARHGPDHRQPRSLRLQGEPPKATHQWVDQTTTVVDLAVDGWEELMVPPIWGGLVSG